MFRPPSAVPAVNGGVSCIPHVTVFRYHMGRDECKVGDHCRLSARARSASMAARMTGPR